MSDADPGGHRQGDRVRVRREPWLITDLQHHERNQVLTLSGIGNANLHRRRRVLAAFETIEPIQRPVRLRRVGARRWRRSCRALLGRSGGWSSVHTAEPAGIEILPHQLEPSLAILRGLGCRALLADDVGLGKTIQAGLIVSELLARGAAERVLLLTPAGLRDQWADELRDRFRLAAEIVDLKSARVLASALPRDVNPWSTVPLAIASLDYVKRAEVLPAVRARLWDVVLVDEAHLVGPDSDRHDAVSSLCAEATYVVLLTATPHSGDRRSFQALCGLGSRGDTLLVFRRTRADVRLGVARHVKRLMVRPSAAETRMHDALARYAAAVRSERGEADRDGILLLTILLKRALSSAESLRRSLERRLAMLDGAPGPELGQLWLPLEDDGGELDGGDEPPLLRVPALNDVGLERRLILAISEAAAAAGARETKLAALARLLRRLRRRGEPAIVFTEYRDTLLHIQQSLALDCVLLHGGLSRSERRRAVDIFVSGRAWILLATDAGAEGLNLHRSCRVVIHVELPWNPVRLEQRTGRVDRIGQARIVHAVHMVARDTGEMRILARLQSRIRDARRDIPVADPLHSPGKPRDTRAPAASFEDVVEIEIDDHRASLDAALGADPGTHGHPLDTEPLPDESPPDRQIVRLADEAAVEASRIRLCRAFGTTEEDSAIREVSFARGQTRAVLRGRAIVMVGLELLDSCGRRLAAYVSPLLVEPAVSTARREARTMVLAWLASATLAGATANDRGRAGWEEQAARSHRLFWQVALARGRAIEQAIRQAAAAPFQPGLFDHRLERERLALVDGQRDLAGDLTRRGAVCQGAMAAGPAIMRTVLVLMP
jgi:superfamily II DNA or RNA helicase